MKIEKRDGLLLRFEGKFVRGKSNECWEWQGSRFRDSKDELTYGEFVMDGKHPKRRT